MPDPLHIPVVTGHCYPKGDGLDYVRQAYGVEVDLGQRVTVDGAGGTVVFDERFGSHYVHVEFDDGHRAPCHPTWRVDYSPTSTPEGAS